MLPSCIVSLVLRFVLCLNPFGFQAMKVQWTQLDMWPPASAVGDSWVWDLYLREAQEFGVGDSWWATWIRSTHLDGIDQTFVVTCQTWTSSRLCGLFLVLSNWVLLFERAPKHGRRMVLFGVDISHGNSWNIVDLLLFQCLVEPPKGKTDSKLQSTGSFFSSSQLQVYQPSWLTSLRARRASRMKNFRSCQKQKVQKPPAMFLLALSLSHLDLIFWEGCVTGPFLEHTTLVMIPLYNLK